MSPRVDSDEVFRVQALTKVISQVTPEGEKPEQYLSQQFTNAECEYAAIEKEALAVKWEMETLWYYLWGGSFHSDHRSCLFIMVTTNEGL